MPIVVLQSMPEMDISRDVDRGNKSRLERLTAIDRQPTRALTTRTAGLQHQL